MKRTLIALLACLLAPAALCDQLDLHVGGHIVHAEIANTPAARQLGLMHRERLCADCGMLFVFSRADRHRFWMKNTLLPLSIAFISNSGSIINIDEMQPESSDIHAARDEALYALEMNRGWFSHNGIKPQARVVGLQRVEAARQ